MKKKQKKILINFTDKHFIETNVILNFYQNCSNFLYETNLLGSLFYFSAEQ